MGVPDCTLRGNPFTRGTFEYIWVICLVCCQSNSVLWDTCEIETLANSASEPSFYPGHIHANSTNVFGYCRRRQNLDFFSNSMARRSFFVRLYARTIFLANTFISCRRCCGVFWRCSDLAEAEKNGCIIPAVLPPGSMFFLAVGCNAFSFFGGGGGNRNIEVIFRR